MPQKPFPNGRRGDGRQSSPDRLHLTCQTLMSLIQWAYSNYADARFNPLASIPISGGPAWIGTKLFQVDAKAASPQSNGAMNGPMLRGLLEERFGLVVRRDIKETPVYALTAAKGAPLRLTPSTHKCIAVDPGKPLPIEPGKPFPAVCGMSRTNDKGYDAVAVTMPVFAKLLSDYADRPVIDKTGLSGEYDIHLNLYASDLGHPSASLSSDDARLARDPQEIFSRVRQELQRLGLHIESSKAPTETLYIEKAETPSPN